MIVSFFCIEQCSKLRSELRLLLQTNISNSMHVRSLEKPFINAGKQGSIFSFQVPNVKWDDVGGLEDVKKSILDTVQVGFLWSITVSIVTFSLKLFTVLLNYQGIINFSGLVANIYLITCK